jgi:H+-transporting ATPase
MKREGTVASGLTSAEAGQRLQQYGPNEAAEERRHPGRALLGKFWAPVPWMLEVTILLQLVLGRVDNISNGR